MTELPEDPGKVEIPKPPEGWWEQVPVLNELYKLLSSSGPVNWELARQVGVALASYDEPDAPDREAAQQELEAMTQAARVEAEEFSGLVESSVAPVQVVTRAEWVEANIESFRFLMDPLAAKLSGSGELAQLGGQGLQVLQQISGVFMGLQTGFVLGYLGRSVVGQYEVPVPAPSSTRLLYVLGNLTQIEADWSLDPKQFRYWIALHEITHHLEFSKTWVQNYFRSQIRTLIDSLDFDADRMQSAFQGLEMLDPESLAQALQDPDRLIQAARTPLSTDAMKRLQAFMTLAEGYATFVMDGVGARVLTDHPRLKEVMERRKRSTSPGEALFERLLGLELKRRQYEEGVKFCRYVAGMHDIDALNKVWDNPESLPTTEELAEPDIWIARVLD
ncbi:MAG: zinc-dependent metalloprotease [Actinomycetota bacterium]